jgi:hypothetical protein
MRKKGLNQFIECSIYLHLERTHRFVFDNIYLQNYKNISFKDRIILVYYKCLFKALPDFRTYLKRSLLIFSRAYYQNRLSVINYCLYLKLYRINLERYSENNF